tara:strand:- start:991 stop:1980 length:990 start_codon:yes stop_codon:yes gene_type:complete
MMELFIIGSGNRILNDYLPMLKYLQSKNNIKVVGVINRTKKNCEYLLEEFQCKYFSSIKDLDIKKKQGNFILSINHTVKDKSVKELIKKNFNIFIDTPLSKSMRLLRKVSKKNLKISFAEDFFGSPITMKLISLINQNNVNKFEIVNKNFTTNYHFFSIIGQIIRKEMLNCNISSRIDEDKKIVFDKISYGKIIFRSETNLIKQNNQLEKEFYFSDFKNKNISSKNILDDIIESLISTDDEFFNYLKENIKTNIDITNSIYLKNKKILKIIGLKNMFTNWINSILNNEEIFLTPKNACEILFLLKTASISRKLNISMNPSKLKLIQYLL